VKDFIGSYGMPWAEETNRALMNVGLERGHPIDRCPAKPHHAEPPPQTIDKLPVWPSSLSGSGPGRLDCRGARRSARRQVGTQRLVVFDRANGWGRILTRRRAPEPRSFDLMSSGGYHANVRASTSGVVVPLPGSGYRKSVCRCAGFHERSHAIKLTLTAHTYCSRSQGPNGCSVSL